MLRDIRGGGATGRGCPWRSWSSRSSSWDLRVCGEVVVMVVVVVRARDGAAFAVSVDHERDVPRPWPRAAPPPRGHRARVSRILPPAFSRSGARRPQTLTAKDGGCSRAGAAKPDAGTEATSRRAGGPSGGQVAAHDGLPRIASTTGLRDVVPGAFGDGRSSERGGCWPQAPLRRARPVQVICPGGPPVARRGAQHRELPQPKKSVATKVESVNSSLS